MKQRSSLPIVYIRYTDVGKKRPRYGGNYFTVRRQITNIEAVPGGEQSTIKYSNQQVTVYRRNGDGSWNSDKAMLGPITVFKLHSVQTSLAQPS